MKDVSFGHPQARDLKPGWLLFKFLDPQYGQWKFTTGIVDQKDPSNHHIKEKKNYKNLLYTDLRKTRL